MKLQAHVEMRILKPIEEVYESIVDPKKMSRYFITSGTARLDEGKPVTWTWADFNAEHKINVQKVEKNKVISFQWSASGVETTVHISFTRDGNSETIVTIEESGWEANEQGIQRYGQQTTGWVHMVTCLKAYQEDGVNLRMGAFAKG
ncbi:SRPBCC domain-containing protein [Bacillus sp. 2205SS5-2]|uniref:SRPBCC domain-containing protein n=1 Tax=Bacillus sp. 2205SS5-2 TaxID=3109031 RepID=UPI003003D921